MTRKQIASLVVDGVAGLALGGSAIFLGFLFFGRPFQDWPIEFYGLSASTSIVFGACSSLALLRSMDADGVFGGEGINPTPQGKRLLALTATVAVAGGWYWATDYAYTGWMPFFQWVFGIVVGLILGLFRMASGRLGGVAAAVGLSCLATPIFYPFVSRPLVHRYTNWPAEPLWAFDWMNVLKERRGTFSLSDLPIWMGGYAALLLLLALLFFPPRQTYAAVRKLASHLTTRVRASMAERRLGQLDEGDWEDNEGIAAAKKRIAARVVQRVKIHQELKKSPNVRIGSAYRIEAALTSAEDEADADDSSSGEKTPAPRHVTRYQM